MKSGITNCTELIFNNFKRKKGAFLLEGLVVAVAATIVFSLSLAYFSSAKQQKKRLDIASNYHAIFYGEESAIKNIKAGSDEVKWVGFYKGEFAAINNSGDVLASEVRFYESEDGISSDYIIKGEMPGSSELLLPDSFLYSKTGVWKIGDKVSLTYEDGREENYSISGFYSLNLDDVQMTEGAAITFDAYNGSSSEVRAEVLYDNEDDIEGNSKKISEAYGLSKYILNPDRTSSEDSNEMLFLGIIVVTAIILAVVLTTYLIVRGVIGLRASAIHRQNAILRSFGIRKKTIYKLSVVECIYVCIPAVLLGAIFSSIVYIVTSQATGVTAEKAVSFVMGGFIPSYFISLADIVLATTLAMCVNVHNGFKRSISDILLTEQSVIISTKKRKKKSKEYKNPAKAYIITSLTRNGWKTIISILPIAIGIFYVVFATASKNDIARIQGKGKISQVYDAKILLKDNYEQENTTDELMDFVSKLDGVEEAKLDQLINDVIYNIDDDFKVAEYENNYLKDNGVYSLIEVQVYDEAELAALGPVMSEGTNEIMDSGCILVNYTYPLMKNGKINYNKREKISELGVGDSLTIMDIADINKKAVDLKRKGEFEYAAMQDYINKFEVNDESVIELEIKGTAKYPLYSDFDYFSSPVIIISDKYYRTLLGDDNYKNFGDEIYIKLKDGAKLYNIKERLQEKNGIYSAEFLDSNRTTSEENNVTSRIGTILLIIAILIAIITMFSTIMMNWKLSCKEYAILKASGASNKKVIKLILAEKSIICLSSLFLGAGLGLLMEKVILRITMRGAEIPMNIPISEIIISALGMMALTLILTVFQSRILKTMSISEVLKESR